MGDACPWLPSRQGSWWPSLITRPMAAWDARIIERLVSRDLEGYSPTAPDVFGITGWY